jgi:hypothetical protein
MVNPLFPLSATGRVVLILIAIIIGLIWSMLMWPNAWRKMFGKPIQPTEPRKEKGKA